MRKQITLASRLVAMALAMSATFLVQEARAFGTDLTSMRGVTIGGGYGGLGAGAKTAIWGGTINLRQADAIAVANGRCAFDVSFDIANLGEDLNAQGVMTWVVVNRLQAATTNPIVYSNGAPDFPENLNAYIGARPYNIQVAGKQSKVITTQVYLPAGTSTLQVRIDPDNKLVETNELNNISLPVTVNLPDLCGGVAVEKKSTNDGDKASSANNNTSSGNTSSGSTSSGSTTSGSSGKNNEVAKPDITSVKGITIGGAIGGAGGKFVAWGGSLTLTDADAFLFSNGNCAYNLVYDLVNLNNVATAVPFKDTLSAAGKVVSIQSNLSLLAGQSKPLPTQAYLPSGEYELSLYLDSDQVVAESNETNNIRSIKIKSTSLCGKAPEAKADLTSLRGVAVGGKTSTWGGSLKLTRADALVAANGRCAFNLSYDLANQGKKSALGFTNRIMNLLTTGSTLIGEQSNLGIDANTSKLINTQVYLLPGINLLQLQIDANGVIAEDNEANNIFQISVFVDSQCK